jgi:hypothetical protein
MGHATAECDTGLIKASAHNNQPKKTRQGRAFLSLLERIKLQLYGGSNP